MTERRASLPDERDEIQAVLGKHPIQDKTLLPVIGKVQRAPDRAERR